MAALERALARVSARAPASAPRHDVPKPRPSAPHASTASPAPEPALEGLAGLVARASSTRASPPAPTAKPPSELPLPAVLVERMEEAQLARRLERILRREAEQAGVDLEGFDP
jgi:hypothetical protein